MAAVNASGVVAGKGRATSRFALSAVGINAAGPGVGSGYASLLSGMAPYAPNLQTPYDLSSSDLTDTAFTWGYLSPTGIPQGGFAIRFMLISSGTWQWWDGSGLSATPTIISSTASTFTPPSGVLLNGNTYYWSVATQDENGLLGPYAQPFTVTGAAVPVVNVTGPTGTLTSGSATLTWINENVQSLAGWQVILYTLAQTQASGFAAGSSPWVWNSGVVQGSASSAVLPSLAVGSFVAYVQITTQQGLSSAWTPWGLTVSYATPAQPSLTATWDSASMSTSLTVVGADTGSLVGNTTATVYRSLDGGSTWTAVSTFTNVPLPSTNQTASGSDPTPLGSQDTGALPSVSYYAVVEGPNGILSPRSATETVQPTFPSNTPGQVPGPGWNFLDATTYAQSWQPLITDLRQSQPIRGGMHKVVGVPEQVQTYDVVGGRELRLTAITTAETDWIALRSLVTSEHTLYVTNVYGLVGFFRVAPGGYSGAQSPGSVASVRRTITFTLNESNVLPSEGAGT